MPRIQRNQIETGVYHIMLRGNERKNIFSDEEDKQRISEALLKVCNDGGFKLYAYCIMDNHLHNEAGICKRRQVIDGTASQGTEI